MALTLRDANGSVVFTSSDRFCRIVFDETITHPAAGTNITRSIPLLDLNNGMLFYAQPSPFEWVYQTYQQPYEFNNQIIDFTSNQYTWNNNSKILTLIGGFAGPYRYVGVAF